MTTPLKDIEDLEDIKLLVDTFYSKVREDTLLGDIFNRVVQDNWGKHLSTMYTFWQSMLLYQPTYSGSPFPPHMSLNIGAEHFNRWVSLFTGTIDALFTGKTAETAKMKAEKMAQIFQFKLQHLK